VQLVRLRAASQGQVAEAFGVDPVTIWWWDQALAARGVAGLVPARRDPKGASKLTPELTERIAGLDAAGATLREIAAATGVSTVSVRNALGRVPSGRPAAGTAEDTGSPAAWDGDAGPGAALEHVTYRQLGVLPPQPGQLRPLTLAQRPTCLAAAPLVLVHPVPQRALVDPQVLRDLRDRTAGLPGPAGPRPP
jgi:lambda repressor-like predicted transcriptional regulator